MNGRMRFLGTFLGVALAVGVVPGIAVAGGTSVVWPVVVTGWIFVIGTMLVAIHPSDIRRTPPVAIAALAAAGLVQDFLLWLLAGWVGGRMDTGLEVDGVGAAVLGAVVTRAVVLLLLAVPSPSPEPQDTGSAA